MPRIHRLASPGLLLAVAISLSGCASTPDEETPQRDGSPRFPDLIGRVEVTVSPSLTDEERSAAIDRQAVPDKINLAVSELLRANQRLDASAPATLAIVITHFRLRSWASAFWLGAMAGADRLGVEVRVEKNGNTLKEYRTETSSVLGGIIFAGAGHRFNRLLKTIAKRIVDGL